MEQFIKAVGDALDRRSFMRRLGKVALDRLVRNRVSQAIGDPWACHCDYPPA